MDITEQISSLDHFDISSTVWEAYAKMCKERRDFSDLLPLLHQHTAVFELNLHKHKPAITTQSFTTRSEFL